MIACALPPPPPLEALLEGSTIALLLDFDGTLVDIALEPDAIAVPPELANKLRKLADRLSGRAALVSGRALDDLERHLGRFDLARAGSHGAERIDASGRPLGDLPQPLGDMVETALRRIALNHGVLFEQKRYGAALHYRSAPERAGSIGQAVCAVAKEHELIVKRGKSVIELVRPGADKGSALRVLMQSDPFAGSVPVFIGDDLTDEDGFVAAKQYGGFGIAVGERVSQNASYALKSVSDVYRWLNL